MPSAADPDLTMQVLSTLRRSGREVDRARAARAAAVIAAFPGRWREWRPRDAWDPTLDDLLAYARAVGGGAA